MIRRPPRSTQSRSSAASDVYKRGAPVLGRLQGRPGGNHELQHAVLPHRLLRRIGGRRRGGAGEPQARRPRGGLHPRPQRREGLPLRRRPRPSRGQAHLERQAGLPRRAGRRPREPRRPPRRGAQSVAGEDRRRRHGRDPLHLRHHREAQGLRAFAPQHHHGGHHRRPGREVRPGRSGAHRHAHLALLAPEQLVHGGAVHGRHHRAPARVPPPAVPPDDPGRAVHRLLRCAHQLPRAAADGAELRRVRSLVDARLIYGGGPIDAETARVLMHKYQSDRFYQVYGMTEAGPTGTTLFPSEQVSKAGSIGRTALPGAGLKVMKSPTEEAPAGEVGEIWLTADSMMVGYFDGPQATERAFVDGWYRTGDVARVDEDGYLFIVDRIKDMIVSGGENVYSKEVEDAIASNPEVAEVAVVGKPHPVWGETVAALVVPKKNGGLTVDDLKSFLAERLAKYKIPRVFRFVDALPYTATGKVMKYQLRDQLRNEPETD